MAKIDYVHIIDFPVRKLRISRNIASNSPNQTIFLRILFLAEEFIR